MSVRRSPGIELAADGLRRMSNDVADGKGLILMARLDGQRWFWLCAHRRPSQWLDLAGERATPKVDGELHWCRAGALGHAAIIHDHGPAPDVGMSSPHLDSFRGRISRPVGSVESTDSWSMLIPGGIGLPSISISNRPHRKSESSFSVNDGSPNK